MDKCVGCKEDLSDVKYICVEVINMDSGISRCSYICDKCHTRLNIRNRLLCRICDYRNCIIYHVVKKN